MRETRPAYPPGGCRFYFGRLATSPTPSALRAFAALVRLPAPAVVVCADYCLAIAGYAGGTMGGGAAGFGGFVTGSLVAQRVAAGSCRRRRWRCLNGLRWRCLSGLRRCSGGGGAELEASWFVPPCVLPSGRSSWLPEMASWPVSQVRLRLVSRAVPIRSPNSLPLQVAAALR